MLVTDYSVLTTLSNFTIDGVANASVTDYSVLTTLSNIPPC